MKQFLLYTVTILLFLSCKKHHDSPHPVLSPTRTALVAHAWVQDSAGTIVDGKYNVIYQSPRLVFTYGFDEYTTSYESQPPYDTSFYELEEPNKIYYWADGDTKDTSRYFFIESLTDKSFVTRLPGNPSVYQWCHAK